MRPAIGIVALVLLVVAVALGAARLHLGAVSSTPTPAATINATVWPCGDAVRCAAMRPTCAPTPCTRSFFPTPVAAKTER